jgi:hypothetical protein
MQVPELGLMLNEYDGCSSLNLKLATLNLPYHLIAVKMGSFQEKRSKKISFVFTYIITSADCYAPLEQGMIGLKQ